MRLFSTTMSAFFRTSSPFIVTTVAPRNTIVPLGVFRGISMLTAISSTFLSSSFSFFGSFFSSFFSSLLVSADCDPPSFLSPSFFSSSLGGSKEMALSGSRNRLAPTAHVMVFPSSAQLK